MKNKHGIGAIQLVGRLGGESQWTPILPSVQWETLEHRGVMCLSEPQLHICKWADTK